MHPHHKTLERFYTAFTQLDADTMAACYAADAQFDDPAFTLRGQREVGGMWRMLCAATQAKGRDAWSLEFSDIQVDDTSGTAHWEAHYRFSATGRLVHNRVDSQFRFNPAGHIVQQVDRFDFWAWSRQALGTPGLLLGWTPLLQNKVRRQAATNLQKFLA